jgi:hypothetical protein
MLLDEPFQDADLDAMERIRNTGGHLAPAGFVVRHIYKNIVPSSIARTLVVKSYESVVAEQCVKEVVLGQYGYG